MLSSWIIGIVLAAIVGAIIYSMIKERAANRDCPTAYCASCPIAKNCTPVKVKRSKIVDVKF